MNKTPHTGHNPVLLQPVVSALKLRDGGVYLDGTFGGGGYTRALLESANCTVHALDRDPNAAIRAEAFAAEFKDRFVFHQGCFSQLDQLFSTQSFDGIVFDFGVSSFQLDEADRGFSFRLDGPLDMRMDPSRGIDAATVVNTYSESDLAKIISTYGEEPKARHVARAIVEQRKSALFETTVQLANCVRRAAVKKKDIDSATLTFQGLRIFVNNELIEIGEALKASASLLINQGTLVTVTFHSLEDRICKQFFKKQLHTIDFASLNIDFSDVTSKPIIPTDQEMRSNPRARSAKLRAGTITRQPLIHAHRSNYEEQTC